MCPSFRAKALKNNSNSASPKKTPTKKANKTPALLDPARLRPPSQLISGSTERMSGEQGRLNMSLGIQQQQRRSRATDDDPFDRIDSVEDL